MLFQYINNILYNMVKLKYYIMKLNDYSSIPIQPRGGSGEAPALFVPIGII